jgi:hypothetical protein
MDHKSALLERDFSLAYTFLNELNNGKDFLPSTMAKNFFLFKKVKRGILIFVDGSMMAMVPKGDSWEWSVV